MLRPFFRGTIVLVPDRKTRRFTTRGPYRANKAVRPRGLAYP